VLRIFATYMRDYSTAEIAYSPTVLMGTGDLRALVRTEVSRAGIPPVSVDYRLGHADGVWKIYDVAIFGISLVKTYHVTIDGELRRHGLDGMIQQINTLQPLDTDDGAHLAVPLPAG
jgi:phospholipid transport system substrate-binding protein